MRWWLQKNEEGMKILGFINWPNRRTDVFTDPMTSLAKYPEARFKRIIVNPLHILWMFRDPTKRDIVEVQGIQGLPEDIDIVHVSLRTLPPGIFEFIIYHPSFPILQPNEDPPLFEGLWYRYGYKVIHKDGADPCIEV